MLALDNVPDVERSETLSRFIVSNRHIRNSDETVKADAFVPHPHEELSVNRDKAATDISLQLSAVAAPIAGNPNHVNVCNWPAGKPEQILKAKEIAEKAKLLRPSPKSRVSED